ncbi:MAG TPA: DUF4198 domain-containing protein [Aliiroseovarius sp.]|nr:DUF4198 domain-containing protein [Aliiroseovarius sp.]
MHARAALPFKTLTITSITLLSFVFVLFSSLTAKAHELYLEPLDYQVGPEGRLMINIVNGQKFRGHKLPYLPQVAVRFDMAGPEGVVPVVSRAGDTPAVDMQVPAQGGLLVFIYHARNATLTYNDAEKFWDFVEHKDLPVTRAEHAARGLPESGFKEVYSRYSKTLVAVGDGAGQDRNFGLLTEIVALANPYTDPVDNGLPVQLLYQGVPRANEQLEVFDKDPAGEVTITRLRTDDDGILNVPVTPGHSYMLDAEVLRLPDPALADETGASYESLWANLTFAVPVAD